MDSKNYIRHIKLQDNSLIAFSKISQDRFEHTITQKMIDTVLREREFRSLLENQTDLSKLQKKKNRISCKLYVSSCLIKLPCITELETVKYLCVLFVNQFLFKNHIDLLFCKLSRTVRILWKSQHLTCEAKN